MAQPSDGPSMTKKDSRSCDGCLKPATTVEGVFRIIRTLPLPSGGLTVHLCGTCTNWMSQVIEAGLWSVPPTKSS